MAEWLYEEGIGENRAVLVERGSIAEALIELPASLRSGAVVAARIVSVPIPGRRAIAEAGEEILVEPVPKGVTEGATARIEIVREAVPEPGRPKRAKGRITDAPEAPGMPLIDRLRSSGQDVRMVSPAGPDLFEQAGWSELLSEAASGEIPFPGGTLRMSLTPAMTLFDVDGVLEPAALAVAGAEAAGRAIRRFGIGGSIGVDLPTLAAREDRQRAAAAIDGVLPQPFERTAVNGFGFLQIVRRKVRASIPEILHSDPAGAAARALLRRTERAAGHGRITLHAAPAVAARISAQPDWLSLLERRTGRPVRLQEDGSLSISGAYVHTAFS
ncbi:MAG TPA: ribonuclease [Allosphingosinicella sp.]|nr:ribonuclease [Allosphingosinicella sp.]